MKWPSHGIVELNFTDELYWRERFTLSLSGIQSIVRRLVCTGDLDNSVMCGDLYVCWRLGWLGLGLGFLKKRGRSESKK